MAAKTEPNISTSNQTCAVAASGWRLPGVMNDIASARAYLGGVIRRGAAVVVNSIGAVLGKRAGTPSAERGPLLSRAIMPLFGPTVTTQSETDPRDPPPKIKSGPGRDL